MSFRVRPFLKALVDPHASDRHAAIRDGAYDALKPHPEPWFPPEDATPRYRRDYMAGYRAARGLLGKGDR